MKTSEGHPGLWWQGGDVPDEAPGVRAQYDAMLTNGPRQRAARERETGGAR
ncbi:hypothetical protein AB0B89_23800 [Sphaerisporangium sp. NPDC049002]|uniref:hypothetical protein n=1 Tax=Sphaerisporangium sp. NPDC049002 TaxID=3155392 RepID=UPI003404DC4F